MATRFCPECGAEYTADVDECSDCFVPLTGGAPATADDGGGDEVVYELDDWEPDLLDQLTQTLLSQGIPFTWEENRNLVIRERDSDRVDDLLDEIEYPDALQDDEGDGDDEAGGADEVPYERVSDLFVAADRLMHAPDDAALAGELVGAALAIEGGQPPYGLAPDEWVRITELASAVRADLAGDADADVVALDARNLRDLLRRFV